MAKIGNLQVTEIKIKNGTLTQFIAPTSGGTMLDVSNASGNPTFIFYQSGGDCTIIRAYGATGFGDEMHSSDSYIRAMVADVTPHDPETYSIFGGTFLGAKFRKA